MSAGEQSGADEGMPASMQRRTLWAVAIAAGLALTVVLALPYAASTRLVGDRIAEEMSEWSGLDVAIGAPPAISIWPDLEATLTNVTMSAPGGGPVVTAERVEIELSALAALGGEIDFTTARFISPTIDVGAGIPTDWSTARGRIGRAIAAAVQIVAENPANPDTARLPVEDLGTVEFDDARVVSRVGGTETEIATDLSGRIEWKSTTARAAIAAKGVWRGEMVTIDAASDKPLLMLGGGTTPLRIAVASAPAELSFDGTASFGQNGYVDGRAKISAPSARRLFEWSGAPLEHGSAIGQIAIESRVLGGRERMRFEDATLTLDGKPARGALDLMLTGKLPMVSGTLAFDTLDLRAFLSAFTPLDASADTGPGVIDADFASRLKLDLRLSAAQATAGAFSLADVAATARVDEGLAAFDISDASAFGGTIQAGLRFDRKDAGTMVELRLLAGDIDGAALATATGMIRATPTGRGTVSLILKGEGESWDDLLGNANGSFAANFGPGQLAGLDLGALLDKAKGREPFALDTVATGASPVDALEVKAAIFGGAAKIEKAEIRTPLSRISVSGTAPLGAGDFNLACSAWMPQQAATETTGTPSATTFLIAGPSTAPHVTPVIAGE